MEKKEDKLFISQRIKIFDNFIKLYQIYPIIQILYYITHIN